MQDFAGDLAGAVAAQTSADESEVGVGTPVEVAIVRPFPAALLLGCLRLLSVAWGAGLPWRDWRNCSHR